MVKTNFKLTTQATLTHQTFSFDRYEQGKYFSEIFWLTWRTGTKFQAGVYSSTNWSLFTKDQNSILNRVLKLNPLGVIKSVKSQYKKKKDLKVLADALWVLAYSHKNSILSEKRRSAQCLGKALSGPFQFRNLLQLLNNEFCQVSSVSFFLKGE